MWASVPRTRTHTSVYLPWCTRSNRGSCRSEWTTFSSTFSLGRLLGNIKHRIWASAGEWTVFVHVDANLQETHPQLHVPHLVLIYTHTPQRPMPAGERQKGGEGSGGMLEDRWTLCHCQVKNNLRNVHATPSPDNWSFRAHQESHQWALLYAPDPQSLSLSGTTAKRLTEGTIQKRYTTSPSASNTD